MVIIQPIIIIFQYGFSGEIECSYRDMLFCGTEWNRCGIFREILKRGTTIFNSIFTHNIDCNSAGFYHIPAGLRGNIILS